MLTLFKCVRNITYISWQEVRCIGLYHNATQGDAADSISNLRCLHVSDERSEAHIEVGKVSQEWLNHLVASCETVSGNHIDQQEHKEAAITMTR